MGRANLRLGKLLPGSPEDLRFRAFFGVSAQVSVTAWDMMENHSSPPYSRVPPFFMGARIHAHISRKRHHSLKFARGARSQDDEQVYVAVHPVNICIERMVGKLIVVFDFIE